VLLAADYEGKTAFHVAAKGNLDILLKIWKWAQEILTKKEIKDKVLLATDNEGMTMLHMAAGNLNLNIMMKVWEWAQEMLTKEEINNRVLLAADNEENRLSHSSICGKHRYIDENMGMGSRNTNQRRDT
jgi:hypothetical protein